MLGLFGWSPLALMEAAFLPPDYTRFSVPNRSLSPQGRRVALAMIAACTLGLAMAAVAIGAWPVMPFAGLEVMLVGLGFHVLGLHDRDYERFEIRGDVVVVESRCSSKVARYTCNRAWARVVCRQSGRQCRLNLRNGADSIGLGRLLSDEQRSVWAHELRGRMQVVAN
jgi:uncharacterized membrane protein